jgi:G:T-mismatch repair DNA endonuclease (very short patch repair protein)
VPKIMKNIERDKRNRRKTARAGWRNFVVWECEIDQQSRLEKKMLKIAIALEEMELILESRRTSLAKPIEKDREPG